MNDEIRALFHEVSGLPLRDRERVLAARQIPPDVREEVESLLACDSPDERGLTACVANAAASVLQDAALDELPACGSYRLVRLLGRGGMGWVYLAERSDGEIRQQVAVKLLAAGEQRPVWRERFLRERQLLASLHHPSIVQMLDAGHTAGNWPYLVMEFIDGLAIDRYASQLALEDGLLLFLSVCDGVAYAHRQLIVHRDLKPSNILVNANGQPKILDFGIARLLDEDDATRTVERMLTPGYASPEQLRGESQGTATDVYSLGAVLHKMLKGRSPREEPGDIPDPVLPADIEFILGKALRSEPGERYLSVDAFAGDIRAFLESRPVAARSGDRWYRARKYLRRYWMPLVAAALVLASLSGGLYFVNRERAIAQRRFLDVRELAAKLLDIDFQVRELPGSSRTRQFIVDTALDYLRRLSVDSRTDPALALEVATAYLRVARVQGVPTSVTLGQQDRAEESLSLADGLIQSVLKKQPANRTAMLRAAQIAHDRMILARFAGHSDRAFALARLSADWIEKFQPSSPDNAEAPGILNIYLNVSGQYRSAHHYDDALRLAARGAALSHMFQRPSHVGDFLQASAQVHQSLADLDRALPEIREAAASLDPGAEWTTRRGQTGNFIDTLIYEAEMLGGHRYVSLDHPREAIPLLERAFRLADYFAEHDAADHTSRGDLAMGAIPLAELLRGTAYVEALQVYDHALRHLAEAPGDTHLERYEVELLAGSSYPLVHLGRADEAHRRLTMAFERLRQLKMYPVPQISPDSEAEEALEALADLEIAGGHPGRGAEIYRDLIDRLQRSDSGHEPELTTDVRLSEIYAAAASAYRRAGQAEAAAMLADRRRDLWQSWERKLPGNAFVHREIESAR